MRQIHENLLFDPYDADPCDIFAVVQDDWPEVVKILNKFFHFRTVDVEQDARDEVGHWVALKVCIAQNLEPAVLH